MVINQGFMFEPLFIAQRSRARAVPMCSSCISGYSSHIHTCKHLQRGEGGPRGEGIERGRQYCKHGRTVTSCSASCFVVAWPCWSVAVRTVTRCYLCARSSWAMGSRVACKGHLYAEWQCRWTPDDTHGLWNTSELFPV